MMNIHLIRMSRFLFLQLYFFIGFTLSAQDDFLYGDAMPDAPELSVRGDHTLGVRTLEFVHKDQVDILNSTEGKDPLYNRKLTVELWYPAKLASGAEASVTYEEVMGTRGD